MIGPLKDFDITAHLGAIVAPTLLFCGEFDEVTPATVNQAYEAIPGSQFVVLEGCAHMSQAERPDLTLGMLRGWLAGVEASNRGHLGLGAQRERRVGTTVPRHAGHGQTAPVPDTRRTTRFKPDRSRPDVTCRDGPRHMKPRGPRPRSRPHGPGRGPIPSPGHEIVAVHPENSRGRQRQPRLESITLPVPQFSPPVDPTARR